MISCTECFFLIKNFKRSFIAGTYTFIFIVICVCYVGVYPCKERSIRPPRHRESNRARLNRRVYSWVDCLEEEKVDNGRECACVSVTVCVSVCMNF